MSLLGGVVTMSGVVSKVTSSSDGTTPKGKGKAKYGTINIAGQEFAIGPDGVEGGGQAAPIPGLPDEPKAALAQLGLTITVPEPAFEVDGKEVKSVVEGLIVEIDTKTLSDGLRQLPLQDILDQLPEETKDLKKALQAGINLSPRIVVHLGRATAKVETADPITIPDVGPGQRPGRRGGDHRGWHLGRRRRPRHRRHRRHHRWHHLAGHRADRGRPAHHRHGPAPGGAGLRPAPALLHPRPAALRRHRRRHRGRQLRTSSRPGGPRRWRCVLARPRLRSARPAKGEPMTTVPTTPATAERASGARMGAGATSLPRAGSSGAAPIKNDNSRLFQSALFWVGASFLPLGLVVIAFGWYGVANTPFGFDQQSYIMSGGFGGLAITFIGGFLYFGSWLAKIADDNREASKRLADTLLVLADVTSRSAAVNDSGVDVDALPVTAGDGATMHRRDCSLIAPPRRPAPGRREQRPPHRLPRVSAVGPTSRNHASGPQRHAGCARDYRCCRTRRHPAPRPPRPASC